MRQTIMLMAACAALLAGCTNEVGEGLGIDTPIQVTASVEGIMTTRAENTAKSLDNFGLYIKDKDDSYTSNYGGENIKASKPEDASVWTLANEVLYQGSGQTYFAYAPHADAEDIDENMILSFSVQADQSTGTNMQASDLLYDQGGTVGSANLSVTFSHKLSKLTVTLQKGENLTENVTFDGVTLRGTKLGTTLALVDDENGVKAGDLGQAEGTATDITMCPTGTAGTYECILVPQEATYSVLINAEVGSEQKTYVYTPSAGQEFLGNKSYTLALTVKNADISMGNIGVNDWDGDDIPLTAGEATEKNYTIEADGSYTVYTAKGLLAWAEAAREGNSRNPVNCTLAADIDMRNTEWESSITYYGTFDGNGHTITGLTNCFTYRNVGTIKNLTLVEPKISVSTRRRAGTVASENWATIENCHVVGGSIEGTDFQSGGIAGFNENKATIRACSSSAAVTIQGDGDGAGGIVGINSSRIIACYATGSVTGNNAYIGAIVGRLGGGELTACYWSGDTEKGVGNGNGSADGTTKVEGNDWTAAMNTMNTALSGTGYRWIENTGDDKATHPLVIATE